MKRTPALVCALILSSCGVSREQAPVESRATLGAGEVARVGTLTVTAESVRRIAAAQRISLAEARSRAVFDALMASAALQRGLDRDPFVLVEQRGVLANSLLTTLKQQEALAPSTRTALPGIPLARGGTCPHPPGRPPCVDRRGRGRRRRRRPARPAPRRRPRRPCASPSRRRCAGGRPACSTGWRGRAGPPTTATR